MTRRALPGQLAKLHAGLIRWPGGSLSEIYHWRNHTECDGKVRKPAYNPRSTFQNFMHDIAIPGHYDVAITVPYGTNPACDAGGDPKEAAAWVAYAKAHGDAAHIKFWTVGNESFGGWEADLHAKAHDPVTYAGAMSGPAGYYALMKKADHEARIGVVVAGGGYNGWDRYVLSHARYDFVELHWYAQDPGKESDAYLLHQAPAGFSKAIGKVRAELAAAGRPETPIMVGELNSVSYNPGKQTVSIVNALFAGQVLAAGIADGLAAELWWFGDGGTQNCGHNNASSLYGFQSWGSYDLIFGDTAYAYNSCTDREHGPIVARGALSPSGVAFQLLAKFARPAEHLLAVRSDSAEVEAFAATNGNGYALLLFNLRESARQCVQISLEHAGTGRYLATDTVYGKAQYDLSRDNVWSGPVTPKPVTVGGAACLALPPWSISLLELTPGTPTAVAPKQ